MSDWTAGYVADIGYTYGYYPELNPLRARLAFLKAGLVCPEVGTACELGFGQGLSANLHAAASVVQWHGTDFNPSQAGFAQALAAAAGVDARLHDQTFAEFSARADLPDFDYIALHGIWSWISDENRAVIVDFIRRKLKVGGVLYISYNTLPGWASFVPMRHLLTQHAAVMGAEGHGIVGRVDGAMDFAERLLALNPIYAKANPLVVERMKFMKTQNRHYLAHEYFNRDWQPMHFATLADWLAPAKLSYACSANYIDHVDALNITREQQAFLGEIADPVFRETVRDAMVNQQFRKDYWVKGARAVNALDQAESLRCQRVVLTTPRAEVSLKIKGSMGEATMNEATYRPLLDLLADHQPRTLAQIEQATGLTLSKVLLCLIVLGGVEHVVPVQDEALAARLRPVTDKLNAHLLQRSRGAGDVNHLASPLTGGGIPVDRVSQLFLLAHRQGLVQPQEWALQAWSVMSKLGHRLVKDGAPLDTDAGNLAELNRLAEVFVRKQLPILQALQIA